MSGSNDTDEAIDGGCNFIDTADVYGRGVSEEFLGRALVANGRRDGEPRGTGSCLPIGTEKVPRSPDDYAIARYASKSDAYTRDHETPVA